VLRRVLLTAACSAALVATAACNRAEDDAPATTGGVETATAPLAVDEIRLGNAIGTDRRVTTETDDFRPTETIYASVRTSGSAQSANLVARWTFEDGQVVNEETQAISPSGAETTEFHISNPSGWPAGDYKLTLMLDGREVGTKDFEVAD
jgi:hypothetical protein